MEGNCATSPIKIEKDYGFLVSEIRNGITEINAEYVKKLQEGDGYLDLVKKGNNSRSIWVEVEFCNFSSWCKFPLYEVDFGMGKVSPCMPYKNLVFLLSTKDGGGIETWINMKEENIYMYIYIWSCLNIDPELLSFTSSIKY